MSKEIDEKVVELRFNNSNFEKNARATMSTIDKLEAKLNFKGAAKGLQDVDKAASSIKFTVLSDAVDKVSVKFNALQVAALTALQNITNKAIDTGEKLVKSLTVDQIAEGYSKYEQKTAAVQTIMNATGKSIEEVTASLEKLNWFTDETSYNFVDMVNNIGKFTSAGVDLDVAVTAMEGIANEAAISGQGINEASRAMYNFAQAIGAGAVKLIDWKSIENANMATKEFKENIIDVALQEGTLKRIGDKIVTVGKETEVSITDFNSALSEGWFSSDVLVKTLQRYGEYADQVFDVVQEKGVLCAEAMEMVSTDTQTLGERAFKAAQEAKTFTDAINATKDAVSTGWMTTFETLFGNYIEAKETWTELANKLYDIFAEGGNVRNELLASAMASPLDNLKNKISETGVDVEDFESKLIALACNSIPGIDKLIEQYGSLDEVLTNSHTSWYRDQLVGLIPKALRDLADDATVATVSTKDLNAKLEEYNDIVYRIAVKGEFGNGQTRFAALEKMGYDWREIQGYVNKFVESGGKAKVTIDDLSDAQLKNIGYTEEEIEKIRALADEAEATGSDFNELINNISKPSGRVLLAESLFNILDALKHVLDTVKEAWSEIFPATTAEMIYNIIEKFHTFTENLMLNKERTDQLKRTFKGLFAVLDIVRQVVYSLVQNGFNLISRVLNTTGIDIFEFTATIGDNLVELQEWLNEGNKIGTVFEWVADQIVNLVTALRDWGKKIINSDNVTNFVTGIYDKFEEYFPGMSDWLDGLGGSFNDFIEKVKQLDGISLDNIVATVKAFRDSVWNYITSINSDDIKQAFDELGSIISTFFTAAGKKIWGFVKDMAGALGEAVSDINPLAIILILAGSSFLLLGERIKNAIDNLIQTLMPVEYFFKKMTSAAAGFVKEATNSMKRISKAFSFDLLAAGILTMSVAISLLAASLIVLSKVENNDGQLTRAVIAIGFLVTVLGAFAVLVPKLSGNVLQVATISQMLISFSLALAVLTLTVKQFNKVNWTSIPKMLLTIAGAAVVLGAAIVIISKFTTETASFSLSIVAFAAGIAILAGAIALLAKLDISGVTGKLITLGVVIGAMFAISHFAGPGNAANAFALIGFVVGINLLIATIASLKSKDMLLVIKYLPSIILIFGLMAVAIAAANDASENIAKAGVGILAMSGAILILMQAVKMIADFDWSTIGKAVVIIDDLFAMFALVVGLSKRAGRYALKAGGMILMMAVAIDSLAIVLWGLSLLDPAGLTLATLVVDSIIGLFAVVIKIAGDSENASKTIRSIGAALGILMLELGVLLAFHDADELLKASTGLSAIILALSVSFKMLQKSNADFKDLIGTTINLTILIGAITGALLILDLAHIDTDGLIQKAASIAIIMTSLGVAIKMMSNISLIVANVGQMSSMALFTLEMSVVLLAITGVLAVLNQIKIDNTSSFLTKTGAIMLLVLELSAIAGILSKSTYFADSFKNMQSMALFMTELSVITGLLAIMLAPLDNVSFELETILSLAAMIAALAVVGTTITRFKYDDDEILKASGTIVILGIVATGLGLLLNKLKPMPLDETMPKILSMITFLAGLELLAFATVKLGKFVENVDMSTILKGLGVAALVLVAVEGLLVLIHAFDELTSGEFSDLASHGMAIIGEQIGGLFGGIVKGFGDATGGALVSIANEISTACSILSSIDEPTLQTVTSIFKAFALLTLSLSLAGVIGLPSWTLLTAGMVELGNALVEFGDSVKGLKVTHSAAIKHAIEPTESLIAVLNEIPKTGGFIPIVFGTSNWSTLSTGLVTYAKALCSFGAVVAGKKVGDGTRYISISETKDAIADAIEPTKKLAEVLKLIPEDDGIWQKFEGSKSWSTLTTGLIEYAEALCTFSMYAAGAMEGFDAPDKTAINNAVGCSKALLEVLNAIPPYDSEWEVKLFGAEISKSNATDSIWAKLSLGLDTYGQTLATFGKTVESLGNKSISTAINNAVTMSKGLVEVITAIDNLTSEFELDSSTSGGIWQHFTNGLIGDVANPGLAFVLQDFALKTSNVDKSKFSNVGSAINELMKPFSNNSSYKPELMEGFTTQIVSMGQTIVNLTGTEFKSAGKAVVDGFIIGIQNNSPNAIKAVNKMGDDVANALNTRLGIHSPSKVTAEDGKYFVGGFVSGIINNAYKATKVVTELASNIIEAFNNRMGIHSDSDEMIDSAKFTLSGFYNTIKNGFGDITSVMSDLATKVVESFDISKITEMGGDITSILSGDFSSLTDQFNKNDYTKTMEGFTKQLEGMTAAGLEDTDAFKNLQKQMNEFKSSNEGAYKYVLSEELNEAQGLYDRLLDDFKKGKITAAEFDKQYVNILKKYSDQASSLIDYHKDQISDYISGSLDEIQSKFESKISSINSEMNSVTESLAKSYDDAIIYTTNKDIYNQKVSEYETSISKLNAQLKETERLYGANSRQARDLQNKINGLNDELEAYKSYYETGGFNDDEIVSIDFSDKLEEETEALFDYADALEKMKNKYGDEVSDDLIAYLGTLDREKAKQTVDWLNSLTGEQFAKINSDLQANKTAAKRVAEVLYRPQIDAATDEFNTAIDELHNKLPTTAESIGKDIVKGITNGFTEETENSLEIIGKSGDDLINYIKDRFKIHSPSQVTKEEIGYNLADGIINGIIERLTQSSGTLIEAVKTFVSTAFAPLLFDEDGNNPIATEFSKVIVSINEALLSGIETQPVIRPVLDLSNVYTGAGELNNMFGYESANRISMSMNSAREFQNRPQVETPVETKGGSTTTFNQYNYSPNPLDRRAIRRDTQSILQLNNYVH